MNNDKPGRDVKPAFTPEEMCLLHMLAQDTAEQFGSNDAEADREIMEGYWMSRRERLKRDRQRIDIVAFGQLVLREAARRVGLSPDDAQAVTFSEKHYWNERRRTKGAGSELASSETELRSTSRRVGDVARLRKHQIFLQRERQRFAWQQPNPT